MTKGISPIIATVIMIALVVSVVGISSTFFTGFTKEQKESVKSKSSSMLECGMAQMEIDKNLVSSSVGEILVGVENIGMTDLTGLKIVVYNETGAFELSTSPSTLDTSEIKMLHGTYYGDFIFEKIKVTCTQCPGTKDSVSLTFSHQEDADETELTGNTSDGDWNTYENIDWSNNYVTYYKSDNIIGAKFILKCHKWDGTIRWVNFTVPNSVFNYYDNKIEFNLINADEEDHLYAYNGSWIWIDWIYSHVYEEAIYWNVVNE